MNEVPDYLRRPRPQRRSRPHPRRPRLRGADADPGAHHPALLAGRDLIGQAQTGTGKTAAFALPMLAEDRPEQLATRRRSSSRRRASWPCRSPRRCTRTRTACRESACCRCTAARRSCMQLKHLERGVQIVVGTPGRLIDHLDRKSLDLDASAHGRPRRSGRDAEDGLHRRRRADPRRASPKPRQIALFSATMPEEVLRIAQRHLRNAERVEIEHKAMSAPAIEQRFLNVSEGQKLEVLTQILELEESDAVLIFRRTKNGAAELAEKLEARGFAAVAMHGDMKQAERESVIRRLRAGPDRDRRRHRRRRARTRRRADRRTSSTTTSRTTSRPTCTASAAPDAPGRSGWPRCSSRRASAG